jgi:protein gp37
MMSDYDWHTYMLLTKRPQRVLDFYSWKWEQIKKSTGQDIPWFPKDNIWIGVTVENQEQAEIRIPLLIKIPCKVKYISCEPLLEMLNLNKWLSPCSIYCGHSEVDFEAYCSSEEFIALDDHDKVLESALFHQNFHKAEKSKIDWVICGAETARKPRVMKPEWARSLMHQCMYANVPFFMKKMSFNDPIPEDLNIREFPNE